MANIQSDASDANLSPRSAASCVYTILVYLFYGQIDASVRECKQDMFIRS